MYKKHSLHYQTKLNPKCKVDPTKAHKLKEIQEQHLEKAINQKNQAAVD